MNRFKQIIGIAPYEERPNVFSPSKLALKMAVDKKTDYVVYDFKEKNQDSSKRILVIGTESPLLEMANGRTFQTGNHPFELFVPMLHWEAAGFSIDIATPTGKSLRLENWAMPTDDDAVMAIYQKYKEKIERPLDLRQVAEQLDENSPYIAVFIPGGHGVMGDLPFSKAVKKAIEWSALHNKWMISICHGPAAFLATGTDSPYKGYKIVAFPDNMDKFLPPTGYLPGSLPWFFGEKLQDLDITVINKAATGKVHVDRKLITGDSPKAANELGLVSAKALLES